VRRRTFIAGVGGAAAWTVAARAQPAERMRRIGVLTVINEDDPEGQAQMRLFTRALQDLGWTEGRNLQMDVRWAVEVDRINSFAKELVGLQPDVIVSNTTVSTAAFQRETRTIPIVFLTVSDPVGSGFVESIARPGGNITGFLFIELGMTGKWLQLLVEIAPHVKRAAIMFNPDSGGLGPYYLPAFNAAAQSLNVEPIAAPVRSDADIEAAMTSLAREPGSGFVVTPSGFTQVHRATIISAAARNNLPAVYGISVTPRDDRLLSYGVVIRDSYRRSAAYVDRILRGAKPADLPVQLPVKFEMTVNLKTAKALGLTVPQSILLRADEVIE
jgi:putative tryptophan/tyrosine transport system substrate-binding protein